MRDLIVKVKENGKQFELVEDFIFYYEKGQDKREFLIPKGFVTDFASVPKASIPLLEDKAIRNKASVLHDYLYFSKITTRKEADLIFYNAMLQIGINKFISKLFYYSVRLFGGKYWK